MFGVFKAGRGLVDPTYTYTRTRMCGYHVPGPTRLGEMSKPLPSSRLRFWKPCSGNSGDCHVWNLATDPSPPHSADGSSATDISPSGFPRREFGSPAGRSFDPSAEGEMTTARHPLSLLICPCLSLVSTDYCLSPCCHTLRCSLTVRTVCFSREEWDHDPPAVTTRNSY